MTVKQALNQALGEAGICEANGITDAECLAVTTETISILRRLGFYIKKRIH